MYWSLPLPPNFFWNRIKKFFKSKSHLRAYLSIKDRNSLKKCPSVATHKSCYAIHFGIGGKKRLWNGDVETDENTERKKERTHTLFIYMEYILWRKREKERKATFSAAFFIYTVWHIVNRKWEKKKMWCAFEQLVVRARKISMCAPQ